jgi:chemotaxis protein MotB
MLPIRMIAGAAVGVSLLIGGCANKKNPDELAQLRQENQQLRARLEDADARLKNAADPTQVQALQNEVADREARIKALEAQLQKPEPGAAADPQLSGIQASYDRKKGELTVNLPGDVLFAPGSAAIKPSAKATLDKIVRAIRKDYPSKTLRVQGHTDADPIRASSKQWSDNLDLSLNRAAAVTRYLEKQGIPKKQIATVGFGETHPKASKAASRRVEIVVVVG